jgi:hypothetical protein
MSRFQVRTPADQVIDDVINLMAARAKEVLEAWNVFSSNLSSDEYRLFQDAIRRSLIPHVKSYKLCGVSNICVDHTRTTSWSPESNTPDPSPQDTVYQFFPKKEMNDFLEDISVEAFKSIAGKLKPETEEGALSSLRIVFRCVLGDYLYFNPVCGHTELCVCSVAAQTSPWWHRAKV